MRTCPEIARAIKAGEEVPQDELLELASAYLDLAHGAETFVIRVQTLLRSAKQPLPDAARVLNAGLLLKPHFSERGRSL